VGNDGIDLQPWLQRMICGNPKKGNVPSEGPVAITSQQTRRKPTTMQHSRPKDRMVKGKRLLLGSCTRRPCEVFN